MKRNSIHIPLLLLLIAAGCSSNSYSDLLKAEEKKIDAFIKRQGIEVVETEPVQWGEKTYYKVPGYDDFYFHLTAVGDTLQDSVSVSVGDNVLIRYNRYTLDAYADTVRAWTPNDAPHPFEFRYGYTNSEVCTGWQLAVKYMRHTGAECKIICPSKLGFSTDNSSVTPYGYDLKLQIKRF